MRHPRPGPILVLLLLCARSAQAENWVDTGHMILIDVDSIRQDPDGLAYYLQRQRSYDVDEEGYPAGASWGSATKQAFDCARSLSYSSYSMEYEANWRSTGDDVRPGTMGRVLLDFVCSRVPTVRAQPVEVAKPEDIRAATVATGPDDPQAATIFLPVAPGRILLEGGQLFVAAGVELLVVDIGSGRVVVRVPAGGVIADLARDPDKKTLWCAVGGHGVRAFDIATRSFGADISLGGGEPGELAVGQVPGVGTRVFVMRYPPNQIQEIDAATHARVGEVEALGFHVSPVLSPDGSRLYVTTQGGECGSGRDVIGVFDAATGRRSGVLGPSQGCPAQVGSCATVTGDGHFLLNNGADAGTYAGFAGGVIHVWDTRTEALVATLQPSVGLGCPHVAPGVDDRFFASVQVGDVNELGSWSLPLLASGPTWRPPEGASFTGFVAFGDGGASTPLTAYATFVATSASGPNGIAVLHPRP